MTAWDLSSATYDSYVSISTKTTNCYKVRLSADGSKLFTLDLQDDTIEEYALSTPYDLSTLSWTQGKAPGSENNPTGFWFKPDGRKVYTLGYTSDTVNQFPLSSAWNISTIGAREKYKSISSQDTASYGLDLSDDGTKMWVSGSTNKKWFQYTLSTAFDVSSATYDNKYLATTDFGNGTPMGVSWNADGTKCYLVVGNNVIYQCSCSTAYDISTATYDEISLDTTSYENDIKGIFFKADGSMLFVGGNGYDRIVKYILPATWNGKINGISYSSIAKINGIVKANIKKINGINVS